VTAEQKNGALRRGIHPQMARSGVTLLIIVASTAIFFQVITLEQHSYTHLLIAFILGSLAHSIWAIIKFKITDNV
jgi:uncharacterized membrane protein